MDLSQRKKVHDHPSDRQSFSSNSYPSGRFPKVSIGVTVESFTKRGSGTGRKDETPLPPASERVASSQGKLIEEKIRLGMLVPSKENHIQVPDHQTATWLCTRSLHKETATTKTAEFYSNQTSILQSNNGFEKKFNSVSFGRKRVKGGITEGVEEFEFATAQKIYVKDIGVEGEKIVETEKQSKEALRMKLWEILGTAPSQIIEVDMENLKTERKADQEEEPVKHHKQSSDTIETDSESPNQPVRRPVTRSLTRKNVPAKTQPKSHCKINNVGNFHSSSNSHFKPKTGENNIFAFCEEEGRAGSLNWPVNGRSSTLTRMKSEKKSEKKSSRIEARRLSSPRKAVSEKNLSGTEKEKTQPPPAKTVPQCETIEGFHSPPSQNNNDQMQSKKVLIEEKFHYSPVTNETDPQEDLNSTPLPKLADLQENIDNPLTENREPQDDIYSPTFAMNKPTEIDSPNPESPENTPMEVNYQSPSPAERRYLEERFYNLRTLHTPGSATHTESLDDTKEFKESPITEPSPTMGEKDVERLLSPPTMEEHDTDSSGEDELIDKGFTMTEKCSSRAGSPENLQFMVRRSKRFRSQEDTRNCEPSPTPPSPKGTDESNGFQVSSGQDQENGLARAVAQFALILERFKTKMKSVTRKQSSNILASVAERIHLQLQNVETQIQTDVGKFTSLGKSKKKHLESRFQEQQRQLKLIHDKFKEEVNQHLHHCRSTLEELEAFEIELKGTTERQKASHRKLLSQVEEAIEIQINDAERSIASIRKAEREKLKGLKHVVMECLSDGVFT